MNNGWELDAKELMLLNEKIENYQSLTRELVEMLKQKHAKLMDGLGDCSPYCPTCALITRAEKELL